MPRLHIDAVIRQFKNRASRLRSAPFFARESLPSPQQGPVREARIMRWVPARSKTERRGVDHLPWGTPAGSGEVGAHVPLRWQGT